MGTIGSRTVKSWILITGCVVALAASVCGQFALGQQLHSGYPYVPAAYSIDGQLVLFPVTGRKEAEVSLPVHSGGYHISPDGKTLYTTSGANPIQLLESRMHGLFKIRFHPTDMAAVPGSNSFRAFASVAISQRQDRAVVAGQHQDGGKVVCGVFDLSLSNGDVSEILQTQDCNDAMTRTDISLSPDSRYAVAIHKRSLELIDMANGKSRDLGDGFFKAAWAPDGRWIAAVRFPGMEAKMVLFDARTLTEKKMFANSTVLKVSWSPDSHFLLARTLEVGCDPDEYTYEAFDVETGKASIIESSRCKVHGSYDDLGWVDRAIATQ